jgi:predicted lipoprotein with Yx(FWY)xxD motif
VNTTAHFAPRTSRARAARRLGALGLTAVVLLAACGDDDDDSADTTAGGAATTVAAPDTTAAPATTAAGTTAPAATGGTTAPAATGGATTVAGEAGGATVATAETDIGTVLVDANGMTLYAFLNDTAGEPTCTGDCAGAWPPAVVEGEPVVGAGLDASVFTVVEHPEAGSMLKAGDWPLYTFAQDSAPGDTNGQGSGDAWFAVTPDGELVE